MSTLQMIPTNKIKPGDNPRGEIDQSSEAFKEFCESIRTRGVLQSILVGPANGDGKHTVIAGHRRFAAAVKTKTAEVPALVVVDAGGAELTMALIENIQREDLSPVAEARAIRTLRDKHGLNQEDAAATLNKSVRWARERERLLNMPEKTQEAYDAGTLPLESIGTLEKLAKQAPAVAEALAEAVEDDDTVRTAVTGDRVPDALSTVIADAYEDLNKDGTTKLGGFFFAGDDRRRGQVTYEALVAAGTPHDQLKAIKDARKECDQLEESLKKLDRYAYVRGDASTLWIESGDRTAAESFGCLLEISGSLYITDAAWLADRFLQHVQQMAKEITSKLEATKGKKKGDPEAEKAAKEARRKAREDEEEARAAARANNLELGQRAQKELAAPKLSLEEAKLFALLAINAGEGIGAGFSYCYHDFQEEERLKNGALKVNYVPGSEAPRADLVASILAAKKPEVALGLGLRAMVLGKYADSEAAIPARSPGCWFPPGGNYGEAEELKAVPELLAAIAEKRSILPDAVRQEVEAERQLQAEEGELELLKAVKASRAKAGATHDSLLEAWRVTPAMIDSAVSRRYLKVQENDGGLTYTLLAAGTKRLEKLKAAEKERQAA